MTTSVEDLVKAVLYEGYALYPYRPSALKNQKRFAFGVLYPRAWAERALEAWHARVEVVVAAPLAARITASVRYLRLARGGGAREEVVAVPAFALGGAAVTHAIEQGGLALAIDCAAVEAGDGLWRFSLEISNATALADGADHEAAMDAAPASTHVVLRGDGARFVSAIDPPPAAAAAAAQCRSVGLYPILAGDAAMLASPIILPDHPEIAPQSPGDFFDGTEIDEMLTLRVLTMTDAEKREAIAADPRVAALIERTERLGIEATAALHGVVRTAWPRQGTRVRLRPVGRADAFDLVLAGKLATVAAVERDLEGKVHCAVTIDDDPGADLPGHRFFFRPDELEVLP